MSHSSRAGGRAGGRGRGCRTCGQHHTLHEPHVYDYVEDPDDDVSCHICLQPLVNPLDTPCGHTFCGACLVGYLSLQQICPIDRIPLSAPKCRPSSRVLIKLLEKLRVQCPNRDSCELRLTRGELEDHLKYRCPGNFVVCRFAAAGCDFKGPQKAALKHQTECSYSKEGITRLPIIDGEISHVEVPRTAPNLGITVVGGSDTALRCIVVQEVFPDGLVAQDGRLQAGDQIIEINGTDMTSATHHQVCQTLRKMTPVLQLGVYRERIETVSATHVVNELHTVTLEKQSGRPLGVRLISRETSSGVGVCIQELVPGSTAAVDGRLCVDDRLLYINGADVRTGRLDAACQLISSSETVSLVISREVNGYSPDPYGQLFTGGTYVSHSRTKSAPDHLPLHRRNHSADSMDNTNGRSASCESNGRTPQLSTTTATTPESPPPALPPRDTTNHKTEEGGGGGGGGGGKGKSGKTWRQRKGKENLEMEMAAAMKRCLKIDGAQLQQKTVTITKTTNESLGMRIGGGLSSTEGDTPIYIANIHPQGPVGKSKQVKKGDILLSVNGSTLVGLTHAQAVAALKATAELAGVTLSILEGPETSFGSANFLPSWLFWQKLPRCLYLPRVVIIHRPSHGSLGFSIVGGTEPGRCSDPIHVLFVVQNSPASIHGKLKCGDRLVSVDGHSLEDVRHADAVALLKQAGHRVTLEVVSWMGTEL